MINKYSTYNLDIPTRDEFHCQFGGIIQDADFNTNHPNPYRIDNQFYALKFNLSPPNFIQKHNDIYENQKGVN